MKYIAFLAGLAALLFIGTGFSGCIGGMGGKESSDLADSDDFCESLKDVFFLDYTGSAAPQPDALMCFASHMETHLPLDDGTAYAGLPYVAQVEDDYIGGRITLGSPAAVISAVVDGKTIEGNVPYDVNSTSPDYSYSFYPHMIVQTLKKEGLVFTTYTIFGDGKAICVKAEITNEMGKDAKIAPVISGNLGEAALLTTVRFDDANSCIVFNAIAGANIGTRGGGVSPVITTVLKSSFSVSSQSASALVLPAMAASYSISGAETEIKAGETLSFQFTFASEFDIQSMEAELISISDGVLSKGWDELVSNAKGWYNQWFEDAPAPPQWMSEREEACYYGSIWTMRHNMWYAKGQFTYPVIFPSPTWYNSFWLWDTCFHSYALREFDIKVAEDQIIQLCELQDPINGEIYNFYKTWGHKMDPPVSQCPFIGWAVLGVYERSGNTAFLEQLYEPMAKFNEWWYRERDIDTDGLCEYIHPWETGWDSSPRWDYAFGGFAYNYGRNGATMMVAEAIDLNCLLYVDCMALAKISSIIGNGQEQQWFEKAQGIKELIDEKMWDEETGLYYDLNPLQLDSKIKIKTPACFFPVWAGIVDESRAKAMIENYLLNPNEFLTTMPFPTVSKSEPTYLEDDYWRGTVWLNINFIMLQALHEYGYDEQADEIAKTMIGHISRADGSIRETYDPETGNGSGHTSCFAWSGAMYIEMALGTYKEDVMGV